MIQTWIAWEVQSRPLLACHIHTLHSEYWEYILKPGSKRTQSPSKSAVRSSKCAPKSWNPVRLLSLSGCNGWSAVGKHHPGRYQRRRSHQRRERMSSRSCVNNVSATFCSSLPYVQSHQIPEHGPLKDQISRRH